MKYWLFCALLWCPALLAQQRGEIPLELSRFYQNSNTTSSLKALIDDNINTAPPPHYSWYVYPSQVWYEFPDDMQVKLEEIRFYDAHGTAEGRNFNLYVIPPGSWKSIPVAVFTGDQYKAWVSVKLKSPQPVKYLYIEKGALFPSEMKLFGS